MTNHDIALQIGQLVLENWQIGFLWGLKYLHDMSKSIIKLEKTVSKLEMDMRTVQSKLEIPSQKD